MNKDAKAIIGAVAIQLVALGVSLAAGYAGQKLSEEYLRKNMKPETLIKVNDLPGPFGKDN